MGKSTEWYRKNPEGRKVKAKKDAEINRRPEQVAKRVVLNKKNRQSQAAGKTTKGDKLDLSHTKNGLKYKPQSVNRSSKSDAPGDVRSRGGKSL